MRSTGGMPSSHLTRVANTVMIMLYQYGFNSPAFVGSFVLAVIVLHDSVGVRRQAGEQAVILEDLINNSSLENTEICIQIVEGKACVYALNPVLSKAKQRVN